MEADDSANTMVQESPPNSPSLAQRIERDFARKHETQVETQVEENINNVQVIN